MEAALFSLHAGARKNRNMPPTGLFAGQEMVIGQLPGHLLLLKGCRAEAESPVKGLCAGPVPDLQRKTGTKAGPPTIADSPKTADATEFAPFSDKFSCSVNWYLF
ncbi:MAG: hypothetical protein JNM68_05285 [Dinghuibacter sp.]|nr:hypothetical protein [Dinghuibacter sp.]